MVLQRKLRPSTERIERLTYNGTQDMQLANTPLLQSITPGLRNPVRIRQMAPAVRGNRLTTHLLFVRSEA